MNPARRAFAFAVLLAATFSSSLLGGGPLTQGPPPPSFEEQFGIAPVALRLTGANHMLDFRFKVVDPVKAAKIVNKQIKPRLLDPETGRFHETPSMAKVGALRQTGARLVAGKVYFIMFSNQTDVLHAGDKVTIAFDEVVLENQIVQ